MVILYKNNSRKTTIDKDKSLKLEWRPLGLFINRKEVSHIERWFERTNEDLKNRLDMSSNMSNWLADEIKKEALTI